MRYIIILALLLSAQIVSAARISHLTIYCREHYRFTVYLDGDRKNNIPLDSIRILNLSQNFYRLRIEFEDTALLPIEKKVFQITDVNGRSVDALYEIHQNKKGEMSINFLSQTIWPAYIDPGKPEPAPFPGSVTAGLNKKAYKKQHTEEEKKQSTKPVSVPKTTAVTSPNCTKPTISDDDLNDALKSISQRSTEDSKLLSAKQIIATNCLTSDAVKKMLALFTTEEKKLELAKYAYPNTVDKGNYFKLHSEFKNDSNIDELNKSILK